MKILFLFPYPMGRAASQRFRFEQYLPVLKHTGVDYDLRPFLHENTWHIFYKRGFLVRKAVALCVGIVKRWLTLTRLRRYDFVFIHREAMPVGPPIMEWLISRVFGRRIIFDFDDAIWIANFSESNRFFSVMKFHSNFFRICRLAHCVSAGNNYLMKVAMPYNSNVFLNPTTIDTDDLHNRIQTHDNDTLTVGWTGSHSTLKYLYPFFNILRKIRASRPIRFIVISDEKPQGNEDLYEFIPWNRDTEIDDLMRFNIGVMPLTHDAWSEGKCGFKALQYMALGMPALVSPVGVNTEIVEHGESGFICADEASWEASILKLLDDRVLIKIMGKAARKRVEDVYSVKSNTPNFLHLFR